MSARRYISVFFTTFFAFAVMTATFNWLVDPYLVFGTMRIDGFNQIKSEINNFVRTAKAFEPFRFGGDALIAGNSRVEMGLYPEHACFKKLGLNVPSGED